MRRLFKFMTVGLIGLLVNEVLLYFFTEYVGLFYLVSAMIGVEIAIINNFIINDKWTFIDRTRGKRGMFRRGIKFNIVSLAGVAINLVVLYIFVTFFSIHYLISNLIGIGFAFSAKYFVNLDWTWKPDEKPGERRKVDMLSLVIPTYNEKENVQELIPKVFQTMRKNNIRGEVIVVDDNSPDGTGGAAEHLKKAYPVSVIHREGKLGLSSAVLEGFKIAKGDVLGVMDADLSHPTDALPDMMKNLEECEMTVGSRYIPGGGIEDWPLYRKAQSKVAMLFARPITSLRDTNSGYFMLRRELIEGVDLNPRGFKIALEIAVKSGARLKEVPILFKDRMTGESKLGGNVVWEYVLQLKDLYKFKIMKKLRE